MNKKLLVLKPLLNFQEFLTFGFSVILFFAVSFSFAEEDYLNKRYPAKNPEGEYLEFGGVSCIKISPKPMGKSFGHLTFNVYSFFDKYAVRDPEIGLNTSYDVYSSEYSSAVVGALMEKGRLNLYYASREYTTQLPDPGNVYIPSETINGDWDLVYSQALGKLDKPIPSALHKVTDERIGKYFDLTTKAEIKPEDKNSVNKFEFTSENTLYKPEMYRIANTLINAHPNDYYIRTIYYDSLIRKGDFKTLDEDILKHKDFYQNTNDVIFSFIYDSCIRAVYSSNLSTSKANAKDLFNAINSEKNPLEKKIKMYQDMIKYKEFANSSGRLMSQNRIDLLAVLTDSRILIAESYFKMFQGKRQEALLLLLTAFQVGNVLWTSDGLSDHLVGNYAKKQALDGLEVFIINCSETKDEIKKSVKSLEELTSGSVTLDRTMELMFMGSSFHRFASRNVDKDDSIFKHPVIQMKTSDAKLQTLRCAASAKQYFIEKGIFPDEETQFSNFIDKKFPIDIFSKNPIRYIKNENNFKAYSIGPDLKDDFAAFNYDPTNGVISSGDIVVDVPKNRKYPFPKKGIGSASKEEILKMFPENLPVDPFDDFNILPLAITDSKPAAIFSRGPDQQLKMEKEIIIIDGTGRERLIPQAQYDPTNGIKSAGDLYMRPEEKPEIQKDAKSQEAPEIKPSSKPHEK